jgi:gentisate 1,2-dioxygenase
MKNYCCGLITPNWTWHDHANDTDAPMIWLDGLDTPLVRLLEAGFYEQYDEEVQPIGDGEALSSAKYGTGACGQLGSRRLRRNPHRFGATR